MHKISSQIIHLPLQGSKSPDQVNSFTDIEGWKGKKKLLQVTNLKELFFPFFFKESFWQYCIQNMWCVLSFHSTNLWNVCALCMRSCKIVVSAEIRHPNVLGVSLFNVSLSYTPESPCSKSHSTKYLLPKFEGP